MDIVADVVMMNTPGDRPCSRLPVANCGCWLLLGQPAQVICRLSSSNSEVRAGGRMQYVAEHGAPAPIHYALAGTQLCILGTNDALDKETAITSALFGPPGPFSQSNLGGVYIIKAP